MAFGLRIENIGIFMKLSKMVLASQDFVYKDLTEFRMICLKLQL